MVFDDKRSILITPEESAEKIKEPDKLPKGKLDVLLCKILVWEPKDKVKIETKDPPEDQCIVLRECESIEIEESYKKLIGTASVKFPRGTVIKKTITQQSLEDKGVKPVYAYRMADGTIVEQRSNYTVAKPEDFKVGQRIRIYLGYYHDNGNKVFSSEKERRKEMDKIVTSQRPMFDGYITKCSVSTPIELKCENLASGLKRKTCVPMQSEKDAKVNDFLQEGGKYYQLEGTGLKLHPDTAKYDINIGMVKLYEDLTVADMLAEWEKYKLYCFVRYDDNNVPCLKVGRSFFSTASKESVLNENSSSSNKTINFDYNVAKDGLTLMNVDPEYLAVSAEGFDYVKDKGKTKQIKRAVTIRLNPVWEGPGDAKHEKFQILSRVELNKKSMKLGATPKTIQAKDIDLSKYTIISYTATHIGITEEELIKEAEDYFEGYNMNGIEGSVTVFGDYNFESGVKVHLVDKRQPEKNGWYLVEEVNTRFGTNGYRQTLKIPYCISKDKDDKK